MSLPPASESQETDAQVAARGGITRGGITRGGITRGALGAGLGLAVLSLLVRLPLASWPMISDEGAYAYVARFWSGEYQLYRDIPFDRPQGIFLLYRAALWLGSSVVSIRLFAALYNALTTLSLYALGRRMFGPRAGLWVGASYAILSAAPSIEGYTANAELFTLLPSVLAAGALWRGRWLLAGALAGAAVAIKPSAASMLLFGLILAATGQKGRPRAQALFSLCGGACLVPAACIAHGLIIDGSAFFDSFVGRRLEAYSVLTQGPLVQLERLLAGVKETASGWGLLGLGAVLAAPRWQDARIRFALLWVLCSIPGMALGGEWHRHYFQQWIPALCLASAGAFGSILPLWHKSRWLGAALAAAALAAVLAFATRDLRLWTLPKERGSFELHHQADWIFAPAAARRVAELSRPGDEVYSAFTNPQIYFYSERRAAVPQLFWREILYLPGVGKEALAAIQSEKARVLVVSNNPPPELISPQAFRKLVLAHYRGVGTIGPFAILVPR